MIDTHAHIDFESYDNRLKDVLSNAEKQGVEKIIIPGVTPKDYHRIVTLIEQYDFLFGAIGVHPSDVEEYNEEVQDQILELAKHPKIVAIGEVGLDYYWDKSKVDRQKEIFRAQIDIAKQVIKPVIVHDRDAHEDTLKILKETSASEVGVVMHCFSGSVEFAQQCVREGFYIALGGVVTFKNAKKPKEVGAKIPLEHLLLETDSPFLTPVPHRGEENEPAYVKYVAQEIAKLKNISVEEVVNQTTKNAYDLFKFGGLKNG